MDEKFSPTEFDPEKHPLEDLGNGIPTEDYIDTAAEKRLIRKLDLHIVPMVMLLYLLVRPLHYRFILSIHVFSCCAYNLSFDLNPYSQFRMLADHCQSFLDRVNIGNARLYGLTTDLHLTSDRYQTAVSLLFVTYLLSELPSNLVLQKFTPSRWIAFLATSWGIIATLTGVCQSYGGLIVCRLLLGLVEGGLFPGMAIYLTLFYTKRELALRVGYLFVSAALAGAVGGLLAYGIGFMDGIAGQRGWRWIMIIEGLPTFVLGIATWWLLADSPETAYYLNDEERELMVRRKRRQIGHTSSGDEFHRADVVKGLKDWKIYIFCAGQFGMDTMLYGYSTFLPTIIKELGDWGTAETQALTIPCYVLGALTYITVAWFSDAQQQRGLYACVFGLISVIGYGVLISESGPGVRYFGCFLVAAGLYVAVGIPLSWLPSSKFSKDSSLWDHVRLTDWRPLRSAPLWQKDDRYRVTIDHRQLKRCHGTLCKSLVLHDANMQGCR